MGRTSKQVQTKRKQQQQKQKHDRTSILSRCSDTDFMQTGNLFSFFECFSGAEIGNKSVFERRTTTGSGSTFFSFQYTSTLTNFTKCLYSHHERRFPWKFGQNHCPRIKQSPLPVEWNAQTLGFVPGFASAPHCGLNRTRVKIEFYQKNQAKFHFVARWTTRSGWWVAGGGGGHLVLKRKSTGEEWRSCVIASHSIESFIK